ncbi:MAG: PCMD domain-containing protein, partial [Muribaculaceae bacterium]|nr:PCMD domain-containing protein [Muribaculaceae bacterium]
FVIWPGRTIDQQKLKEGMYNITVVMSSSQDGDYFSGAIGSTLKVDELLITCKTQN